MDPDGDLQRKLTKLRNNVAVFGVWHTLRAALSRALAPPAGDDFDRTHGVLTDGDFSVTDATGANRAYASPYQPTHAKVLRHVLRSLPLRHRDYTFVDLGCGRGRAMLMAGDYPFARVVGVDFSPSLCRDARRNLELWRAAHPARWRAGEAEVVCADVCQIEAPDGDLVLYLFNPFEPPVLERVLERVEQAVREQARDVLIAYCHTKYGTGALAARGCELLSETRVLSPWWSWSLWRWPRRPPPDGVLWPVARQEARARIEPRVEAEPSV
jgi:SAM-dependent methyltransferase